MDSEQSEGQTPDFLFRFRSCSTTYFEGELRHALDRQEQFFAPLTLANDPFDCNPSYQKSTEREIIDVYRRLGKKFIVDPEAGVPFYGRGKGLKRALKKDFLVNYKNVKRSRGIVDSFNDRIRNESKIIYLTESWENPLMWAHYAGGHNGVALKFSVDTELAILKKDDVPLPIAYSNQRPVVSTTDLIAWFNSDRGDEEMAAKSDHAFSAYVLTKPRVWEYEKEWRIQKRSIGSGGYEFVPALKLSEVYVGVRVGAEQLQAIRSICDGRAKVVPLSIDDHRFSLKV